MIRTGPANPTRDPVVTLRLANLTELAVEAEIYISTNGQANTPDTLFTNEYLLTNGVGLASTGVLIPETLDIVQFECDTGLVIGTAGGVFQDAETGEVLGAGVRRLLQEDLVFDCGAIVTFAYREVDGAFTVDVSLDPGDLASGAD
jgi:hypothetical protein